jgi:hypothetical protein
MVASRSTTVVVVGSDAPAIIAQLGALRNVRAAAFAGADDSEVRRWLSHSHSPYVVHDRDPLAHVAAAWVEFFDDLASLGTLDLEVDRAVTAFGRDEQDMPDYYLVAEPEELSPTWKHWWLGVLPQAAPTRVIPWSEGGSTSLARVLRTLPTSRLWPAPRTWLGGLSHQVPDRVGLEGSRAEPEEPGLRQAG